MWKSVELRLKPGFFCLLAMAVAWGAGEVLPWILLSAFCHELGHLMLLRLFGIRPQRITLSAAGVEIEAAGQEKLSYGRELLCVLSGPAVNLLLAILFARVFSGYLFAGTNGVLAVYNLLPIRNLDGGRALYLLVSWCSDPFRAEQVAAVVNLVTLGLLLGFAVLLLVETGNAIFCLTGGFGLVLGQLLHRRRGKQGCQTEKKQLQ